MCSLNGPHLPIQRPAPVVTSWSFQESATCSPKSPNAGRKTLIKSAQWKSYDVKGSSGSVLFHAAMVMLRLIGLRKQKRGAQTVWTKFKCLTCELWNSVVLLHPKAFHLDNTVKSALWLVISTMDEPEGILLMKSLLLYVGKLQSHNQKEANGLSLL